MNNIGTYCLKSCIYSKQKSAFSKVNTRDFMLLKKSGLGGLIKKIFCAQKLFQIKIEYE